MTGDDMAAELIAHLERAFEIDLRAGRQRPTVVSRSVSAAASTANQVALPSLPRATTVRHTPLQAIEAPIAIVSGS